MKTKANMLSLLLFFSPSITKISNESVATPKSDVTTIIETIKTAKESDLEYYKELLIAIIAQESTYNKYTDGDNHTAKGCLQIHKSFVTNLNKQLKKLNIDRKYTFDDRLSVEKSIRMFLDYQLVYNPTKDIRLAAIIWNCGQNCNPNSKQANDYWSVIQKHMADPINPILAERLTSYKNTICV